VFAAFLWLCSRKFVLNPQTLSPSLTDQHTISIAVKAVACLDGVLIGLRTFSRPAKAHAKASNVERVMKVC